MNFKLHLILMNLNVSSPRCGWWLLYWTMKGWVLCNSMKRLQTTVGKPDVEHAQFPTPSSPFTRVKEPRGVTMRPDNVLFAQLAWRLLKARACLIHFNAPSVTSNGYMEPASGPGSERSPLKCPQATGQNVSLSHALTRKTSEGAGL